MFNFFGGEPPLGFRFGVFFFVGGLVPNPLDIRFQKVSGLGQSVQTETVNEGGQNLYTQKLPKGMEYQNLKLERGFVSPSILTLEFTAAMQFFQFYTSHCLVMLFNENSIPKGAWLLMKAYPIKWDVSAFNASQSEIVVDTMELSFQNIRSIRL